MEIEMGSLNNDSYIATAWLIIVSIATAFGSPVMELSNVGLMIRPVVGTVAAVVICEFALGPEVL
jgi:hypothetical protein